MTEPLPVDVPAVPAGPLSAEGRALLDADRPRAAVEVLRRAVAAGEPSAEDLLARAYLDSGSWQEAVDRLAPLVEQGEVRFAGRLGVALAGLGDAVRAEEALRLAVESGEVAASNDLAILLRDRGRLAEAVATLLPLADAGDGQAAANLVALTLEEGDLAGAIAHAERYADERRPDTLVALAEVRAAQGRADEAETLHRRACELGALRAHTAYGTFLLLVRLEPEEAEREYLEARRLREPGWAWTLGRFLLDQGRPDEARDHLEHAAARGDRAAEQALVELDGEDEDD